MLEKEITLALIVLASGFVGSTLGPILVNRSQRKQRTIEKREEAAIRLKEKLDEEEIQHRAQLRVEARQDEVARLAAIAAKESAEANKRIETVSTQIDGMLRDRDRANVAAGAASGAAAGVKIAEALAAGQQQGRDAERESAAASKDAATQSIPHGDKPVSVLDKIVGEASQSIAESSKVTAAAALEQAAAARDAATAAGRSADAQEEAGKKEPKS